MPGDSEYNGAASGQALLGINSSKKSENEEICSNLNCSNSSTSSGYGDSGSSSTDKIVQSDTDLANEFDHEVIVSSKLVDLTIGKLEDCKQTLGDGNPTTLDHLTVTGILSEYGKSKTTTVLSTSNGAIKPYEFVNYEKQKETKSLCLSLQNSELESGIPNGRHLTEKVGSGIPTLVLNNEEEANLSYHSDSINSSGISDPGKKGVLTSTPVKKKEQIQVVSFRDSAILYDSPRSHESEQTLEQQQERQGNLGWYGLPAPMFGTMVPNRIFVGGLSPQTTENDLTEVFTAYGNVRASKIISDRAGVSKGYGFVTYETEQEASSLCEAIQRMELEPVVIRDRRLNIAPAVKKQQTSSEVGYQSAPPSPPPYMGPSYYMSQGNPSQYYYQAAPIHEHFYAPNSIPYGSGSHSYYATQPIPNGGSVYCLPEQYQTYPSNPIPYYGPPPTTLPLYPPTPPPQYCSSNPTFYHAPVQIETVAWQSPAPTYPYYEAFDASVYYSSTCAY